MPTALLEGPVLSPERKEPQPPPCNHNWTPRYDNEGEIIGRVCTKCGAEE